jgi:hypothetical protein
MGSIRVGACKGLQIRALASRYGKPIPTRFLAPIDCSKIPAQHSPCICIFSQKVPGPLTFKETRNRFQGIDSAANIAWRAATTTLFLLGSNFLAPMIVLKFQYRTIHAYASFPRKSMGPWPSSYQKCMGPEASIRSNDIQLVCSLFKPRATSLELWLNPRLPIMPPPVLYSSSKF